MAMVLRTTGVVFAAALALPLTVLRGQDPLPDGPGKPVVVRVCGACHDLDTATGARHTRNEWRAVVESMIDRGAKASDEEIVAITGYLTAYVGLVNVNKAAATEIETVLAIPGRPGRGHRRIIQPRMESSRTSTPSSGCRASTPRVSTSGRIASRFDEPRTHDGVRQSCSAHSIATRFAHGTAQDCGARAPGGPCLLRNRIGPRSGTMRAANVFAAHADRHPECLQAQAGLAVWHRSGRGGSESATPATVDRGGPHVAGGLSTLRLRRAASSHWTRDRQGNLEVRTGRPARRCAA